MSRQHRATTAWLSLADLDFVPGWNLKPRAEETGATAAGKVTGRTELSPLSASPRVFGAGFLPGSRVWAVLSMVLLVLAPGLPAQSQDPGTGQQNGAGNRAFQPIAKPAIPAAKQAGLVLTPIDAFILAKQDTRGIEPAPLASRVALLRRISFDVTGLPPTPDEIEAFLTDSSPDAFEKVVERLLASPAYGERWARHWLDVVRYADTDGFAIDEERPTLWRYRDYVVRVFNEDRPFDRFIREQLAGDELEAGSEGIVATGFYRLGPWEADNMVPENKRQDYLNEITDTVGSVFLGITVGCARCHDHKYDPVSIVDYYSLQAFLSPMKRAEPAVKYLEVEKGGEFDEQHAKAQEEMLRRQRSLSKFRTAFRPRLAAILKKAAEEVDDKEFDGNFGKDPSFTKDEINQFNQLKMAVGQFKGPARFKAVACAVANPSDDEPVPETRVLNGGSVTSPLQSVTPAFLSAVPAWSGGCFDELPNLKSTASGRRKVLAEWVASPKNPLTARVLVNRLWQYHFGAGIVSTANDFGVNGSGASHPELLDFLAASLIENDWRLKPLHRLMLLSRTYQISSRHPQHEVCAGVDPDNRLLWRAPFRRLEGEALRDAMLAVSGRLLLTRGGPGFLDELPPEMGRDFDMFKWDPSEEDQRRRRSLYQFQRRNLMVPMMESFDAADRSASCPRRGASVTTPQVFSLFNSQFAYETSRHFARRVQREAGTVPRRQVEWVYSFAFGRKPSATELDFGARFLEKQPAAEAAEGEPSKALADLCLVAMNANEFLYLE